MPSEYVDVPIAVDADFDTQASAMFLVVRSKNAAAAVAWSATLARSLQERMKDDTYLAVEVLDPAERASSTGQKVRLLGIIESFGLAFAAFVLVAFGLQRLEESRDVPAALRRRGVRVLGSVVATRANRARPDGVSVLLAALVRDELAELVRDEHEDERVLVTALADRGLAEWLVDRLNEAQYPLLGRDSVRFLDAVPGPLLHEFQLWSMVGERPSCIVAVDGNVSSVAEIVSGVQLLDEAGVLCRGVVLIRGSADRSFEEPRGAASFVTRPRTHGAVSVLILDGSDRGGIALYTAVLLGDLRDLGVDVALAAPPGREVGSPPISPGQVGSRARRRSRIPAPPDAPLGTEPVAPPPQRER